MKASTLKPILVICVVSVLFLLFVLLLDSRQGKLVPQSDLGNEISEEKSYGTKEDYLGFMLKKEGKLYVWGDEIVIGHDCTRQVKGRIIHIEKDKFIVRVEQKQEKNKLKPDFEQIEPYELTVYDGLYIANDEGYQTCLDVDVKGTKFELGIKELAGGNYLLELVQEMVGTSGMKLPR